MAASAYATVAPLFSTGNDAGYIQQAGWKAIMRTKTMPKASLRLKVFFQIGQIYPLLPQLWKTNAHSVGCGS